MRFSLMSLLLAFAVVWSSLATFGIGGIAAAVVLLAIAVCVRTSSDMGRAILKVLIPASLIFLAIALSLPVRSRAREAARRSWCRNNMKQIVFGLHNYHDAYGCFPPAYVAGPDGSPWHSWRVLILPFVEEAVLYDQYDFNEPWNGPSNGKLAAQKPRVYACPSDPDSCQSPTTNYAAVVGPKAAWAGSEPRKLDDFRHADSTILFAEAAGSQIHWMEPRDLKFDDARTGVHAPGPAKIAAHHFIRHGYFYHDEPGSNIAMADGSVRSLPQRTRQATLEAMLTIDGDEQIDLDFLPDLRPRPNWSRIFAPIVLIVSYLILLLRPRKRGVAQASSL